ncbi:MAG: SCO6880 family protein [Acidimicrobiales bacterium]
MGPAGPPQPQEPRYRFGPLERRGLIAGWRGGQVAVVAASLVVAVVALRAGVGPSRLPVAAASVAVGLVVSCWPVRGRTAEQWAPVVLGWAVAVVAGRHHYRSAVPSLGFRPGGAAWGTGAIPTRAGDSGAGAAASSGPAPRSSLGSSARSGILPARRRRSPGPAGDRSGPVRPPAAPPPLAGCRILLPTVADGGLRAGVIHDPRSRTYTGVLAAAGSAFALLAPDEQQRRVASWSGVLAGLAREGSPVHRIQWVERNLPWGDGAPGIEPAPGGSPAVGTGPPPPPPPGGSPAVGTGPPPPPPPGGSPAVGTGPPVSDALPSPGYDPGGPAARSYAELAAGICGQARRHEILLAVSVHAERAGRPIRAAGGGAAGACVVLAQELASLASQLAGAGILVQGALHPAALCLSLRRAVEASPGPSRPPDPDWGQTHEPAPDPDRVRVAVWWPWPMATEAGWGTYRTDATWHATYWVAEWPRIDVGPGFLTTLLLRSGVRHTVALTMEPVGALQAQREVRQARTADVADAELRRRGGFLATARRQRETEVVARREVELADGHAQYRFSGYVTVTAAGPEALEIDCGRMEQAASQAGLELARLYGQQDQAFTWTLPLARGLS